MSSLSVSLVIMCVVASVPPGTDDGQCWGQGTLVTTGDQAGAGHGDTHTWSLGHQGPGEITPCILSSLHLASPANHPRYFVQLQVVCAFWIRRIKLKMFYVCICIWIIEIERCIFCVCVELKVSLVICN